MNRYEFLNALHEHLKPKTYLEIGVQYGYSMSCAKAPTFCVGIDPKPLPRIPTAGTPCIYAMTSDEFFEKAFRGEWTGDQDPGFPVDLAFIDGMHLVEYALRDFMNVEKVSHPHGFIVFDDVLPYSEAIATREQPPGDWTGDVWKVHDWLKKTRPDLVMTLVNVQPTGLLVVQNLDPTYKWDKSLIPVSLSEDVPVPESVLHRTNAYDPRVALEWLLNPDW